MYIFKANNKAVSSKSFKTCKLIFYVPTVLSGATLFCGFIPTF